MRALNKFIVFSGFLFLALFFWRLNVLLFYNDGGISLLRELTGLTIHHYHYGLLIVLMASLLIIFFRNGLFSVGLMGFGLGSVFDSFISRLFRNSGRMGEIINYNNAIIPTTILFFIIVLMAGIFCLMESKNRKSL
jgi:hypothetical protein